MHRSDDERLNEGEPGAQGVPMTSDAPAHGGAASPGAGVRPPASPPEDQAVASTSASGSGVSLVQNGWHVVASDGENLGRISRLDEDRMIVDRDGLTTPDKLIVPRGLIAVEDETAMQVFLAIDSSSADQFAGEDR